jgi:hypothetical protein
MLAKELAAAARAQELTRLLASSVSLGGGSERGLAGDKFPVNGVACAV